MIAHRSAVASRLTSNTAANDDCFPKVDAVKLLNVVKTNVYLHDLSHFPTVNEIYGKWLGDARPARSTVQVPGLPRGALVEIDAVAVVSSK